MRVKIEPGTHCVNCGTTWGSHYNQDCFIFGVKGGVFTVEVADAPKPTDGQIKHAKHQLTLARNLQEQEAKIAADHAYHADEYRNEADQQPLSRLGPF